MTIDRAIEIVNPTTEKNYGPEEWFQAQRLACQALALLRPIPAAERKPEPDEFVLGWCYAKLSEHAELAGAWEVVEYDEYTDRWLLAGWPEIEDVKVSHWVRLPEPPEGVES